MKFLVYGLLLLGIYYSSFTWLVTHDWEREAYSYCWLIPPVVFFLIWIKRDDLVSTPSEPSWMIPPVVFFLIWIKRDDLVSTPSEPSWMGLLPIGVGIVFFWLGELSGEFFTLYISFWLVLVGICLLHLGWQKLKPIAFALFFILTMFPVPNFINTRIMLQLRLCAIAGGGCLQRFAFSDFPGGVVPAAGIFFQGSYLEASCAVVFIHTSGHCFQQHAHSHDRHSS